LPREERQDRRLGVVVFTVAVALAHVWFNTVGLYSENLVSAFHFASFALLSLFFGERRGERWWTRAWEVAVPVLAAASGVYLILFEEALYERGQDFSTADWVFAVCAVAGAVELTRRSGGWVIPALVVAAVSYVAWWGKYVPGVFSFPGLSLESVLYRLYFSPEGMFGMIARISWSYVFMFMLFGSFLLRSGGGDFVVDLARAVAGRIRGGPGYVAVLASGLMGSISGSAIANAVATGSITIPLMKRTGFSPRFAAAVEAAASTGGQLMPPIMGAGAFIMASYTQVPYLRIIAVALLPALLYFVTVALFVRVEVAREGLAAAPSQGPGVAAVLKTGWRHAVPLAVLVAMLIHGFSPTYAAAAAMLAVVAVSWLGGRGMKVPDVVAALVQGVRGMIATALLLVAIGLVVNVITTTGLGSTLSLMIVEWSQGSLALMLLLLALVSLVLGMGLPVTASYVVLATVAAAALQGLLLEGWLIDAIRGGEAGEAVRQVLALYEVGDPALLSRGELHEVLHRLPAEMKSLLIEQTVPASIALAALLTAHMILFWLSQDSNVTPPVCLAAFTAATLAESPPMATGLTAWKVAKGLYVVPVLMAYQPFVGAGWVDAAKVFVVGLGATLALIGVLEGFGAGVRGWLLRLGCLGAVLLFLVPGPGQAVRFWSAAVFVVGAVIWAVKRPRRPRGADNPVE
jgi:TRAP transporter 4TM/12TM fusion protein